MAMSSPENDDWGGSTKRPWINPPMKHDIGATRGAWRFWLAGIVLVVIAVIVVLVLVDSGHLAQGWAYAVLPVAIIAAAASRLVTVLKADVEDKSRD
jgi:hypothetical protein